MTSSTTVTTVSTTTPHYERTRSSGFETNAHRITSIALSALLFLVTFCLLPWQGALIFSLIGSTCLITWGWTYDPSSYAYSPYSYGAAIPAPIIPSPIILPQAPWYRRQVDWFPFSRRYVPVADPRPREIVGHRDLFAPSRHVPRETVHRGPAVPPPTAAGREIVGSRTGGSAPRSIPSAGRPDPSIRVPVGGRR